MAFNLDNIDVGALRAIDAARAPAKLIRIQNVLPFLKELNDLVQDFYTSDTEKHSTLEQRISSLEPIHRQILRHLLFKEDGNRKYKGGEYQDAISDYVNSASIIVSTWNGREENELPSLKDGYPGMYIDLCSDPTAMTMYCMLSVASCYNNIAQCHLKLGNHLKV